MVRVRPNRATPGFDIAAIAAVSTALAALLVLVLLLGRAAMQRPQMERRATAAESESGRLASDVARLAEQSRQRTRLEAADVSALSRLRARILALEAEHTRLNVRATAGPSLTMLLLAFSAHCEGAGHVDFYVHGEGVRLADGSDWDHVRPGDQPLPQGVVVLREESAAVLANLFQPSAELLSSLVARSLQHALSIWIVRTVPAAARFALYAKAAPEAEGCAVTSQVLATHAMPGEGRAPSVLLAGEVRKRAQIVLLGRVVFDGRALIPLPAAAGEQDALDRRFLRE
jgi:hypothetical protein